MNGLGKTFVGSEKMAEYGEAVNLVVCQKSKVDDWLSHFRSYYPEYEVRDMTLLGGSDFKAFKGSGHVVGVINYDLVFRRTWVKDLRHITLMLDESSLIQNEQAKRSKALLKMDRAHTILLSGTVVNGKYERLWSQCHLLGWPISRELFWRQYIETETVIDDLGYPHKRITGYRNIDRLKRKLREYGAVFMKTEDVHDLPPQNIITIEVPTSKEYRRYRKSLVITVDGDELVGKRMLTERMHKRMLCGQYSAAKLQAFRDLVESTDDRLLVFYNFTAELEKLETICTELGRPVSIVNGNTKDLAAYEAEPDSVTLIQYQAGAMGLNLQRANKIIYFTLPDGGSELFEQSRKRIHRIGQERPCFYYLLICKDSIEDREVVPNLGIKKDRMDELFREGKD